MTYRIKLLVRLEGFECCVLDSMLYAYPLQPGNLSLSSLSDATLPTAAAP